MSRKSSGNPRYRLTSAQLKDLITLKDNGNSWVWLADRFNVPPQSLWSQYVMFKKTGKHVEPVEQAPDRLAGSSLWRPLLPLRGKGHQVQRVVRVLDEYLRELGADIPADRVHELSWELTPKVVQKAMVTRGFFEALRNHGIEFVEDAEMFRKVARIGAKGRVLERLSEG